MTAASTYYALLDETRNREQPLGVFRRVRNESGQTDEVFSRNLKWEFSPLLYSAERGDTMYEFTEISEDEAGLIVDRIKAEAAQGE